MATFSNGKSVLLDSNPENDDSDIDFTDVFGGPPRRRSSVHEVMRHGFSESAADSGGGGGGERIKRGRRWSGATEKPVFGEETTNRRRLTTDDFFNDIFGGKETILSRSPRRRSERDAIGSKPGSRVLSPAPPLPPKAEPFGTSLPPPLSLPAKLPKRVELPTFGSPARGLNKILDAALNSLSTYSYSPLSRSSSLPDLNQGQENVTNGSPAKCDADEVQEKGNVGSTVSGRGRQFHFSIYKWPNRGVPLVMSLGRFGSSRFRVTAKVEPRTLNDVRFSSSDDEAVIDTESSERGADEDTDVKDKETEHDMLSEQRSSGETVKDASGNVSEVQRPKPKLNSLRSFFFDNDDEQGEGEAREDKSKVKNTRHSARGSRNEKKPDKRRGSSDSIKSAKPSFSTSPSTPGPGEVSKNGVEGKVKEFVKIFNQGPSILSGGDSLGQSSRWRGKENMVIDINKTTDVDQTEQMSGEQKKQSPDSPAMGQNPSRVSEKKDSNTRNMKNKGSHGVSGQESSSAQTTSEDADESFHVNFQVREITEDENKLEQPRDDPEAIQIIDANIRKWSNGKDGNIRSLLSTLQYILWLESGWKPVPLMEMIEGNAVRKSYQKALLILHPDKLQQKGASANQKYIAERVFKLLQEAWECFNLLGSL